MAILSRPVYRGFGPTLASEHLAEEYDIEVSRETVRQWMMGAKTERSLHWYVRDRILREATPL